MPTGYFNSERNIFTWISYYLNIPLSVLEKVFTFVYVVLVVGLIIYYLYNKFKKN